MKDASARERISKIEEWADAIASAAEDEFNRAQARDDRLAAAFQTSEDRQRLIDRIVRLRLDLLNDTTDALAEAIIESNNAHAERFAEIEAQLEEATVTAFSTPAERVNALVPEEGEQEPEQERYPVFRGGNTEARFGPDAEFVRTGEVRPPQKGEVYLSEAFGERAILASRDQHPESRVILREVDQSATDGDRDATEEEFGELFSDYPDPQDGDDRLWIAIGAQVPVSFGYRDLDGNETVRVVSPWDLSNDALWAGPDKGQGTLLAYDHVRGAIRRFRLAGITSLVERAFGVDYEQPRDTAGA